MQRKRTLCVHRLAKDRNQAIQFGRFLANSAVTTHAMLVTPRRLSNQRAAGRPVLAIMDTTDLRFPTHAAGKRGFGRDGHDRGPGLFLSPVLAADAGNGGVIGPVDGVVLNRTVGKVTDPKKRAGWTAPPARCRARPQAAPATGSPPTWAPSTPRPRRAPSAGL